MEKDRGSLSKPETSLCNPRYMLLEAISLFININKFINYQHDLIPCHVTNMVLRTDYQNRIIKALKYIIMIQQQIEASNNLASLSQRTNYIQDWTGRKIQRYRQVQKDTIPEQYQQDTKPRYQTKRQKQIKKEVSEKYDLRKCQNKLQAINQLQLPLPHRNLFKLQESYKLPKHLYQEPKQLTPNILTRKANSIHSYRCAEGQFLKRRLQIFERKNVQSQKDLHSRRLNSKLPSLPRLFEEKRNQKLQFKKKKPLVSEQEIEKIKRAITKQSKRYSVPLLISEAQGLPLIKGLLH